MDVLTKLDEYLDKSTIQESFSDEYRAYKELMIDDWKGYMQRWFNTVLKKEDITVTPVGDKIRILSKSKSEKNLNKI